MKIWDALEEYTKAVEWRQRADARVRETYDTVMKAHDEALKEVASGFVELRDPNGKAIKAPETLRLIEKVKELETEKQSMQRVIDKLEGKSSYVDP